MDNTFFRALEASSQGHSIPFAEAMKHLVFDSQGLIPVIAQQFDSGEVLMMAWMNQDALQATLQEGQVCYWSRSRQQLWRKGESSGHRQRLVEMRTDCDGDAILCLVDQTGPACHTNRNSCFYFHLQPEQMTTISSLENDYSESTKK